MSERSREKPLLQHNAAVIDMITAAILNKSLEPSQRDGAQTQDNSRADKKQI